VHKTDSDETFHSVKLHRMVGLNVRKWGFYDKTVKNFKPFCWWDAFRSVWMTQQNAPTESVGRNENLNDFGTTVI
jgi:hypothetical protein